MVNAPSFIAYVWAFCKLLMDERTRKKVHILTAATNDKIFDFVDRDQLPVFMGGTCQCACEGGCIFSKEKGPWGAAGRITAARRNAAKKNTAAAAGGESEGQGGTGAARGTGAAGRTGAQTDPIAIAN